MKFETIVNQYSNLAYKVAIDMVSSPENAQDIVQEAYLSLYSHFNEYKEFESNEIKNILCKIVLNKCKDFFKSAKRKESTDLENVYNLQEYSLEDDNIEEMIKDEEGSYIQSAIQNLKSPYSELLMLYYIEEKSLDEVASTMKTTKGTIKVQITRGKQKLKEVLRKERCLMNDNIDKIDKLLNDDFELEKYLNSLENKEVKIPANLNENIKIKINNKNKIKNYLFGICKIAACLIFSLSVCRMDFMQNEKIVQNQNEVLKSSSINEEKVSEFCKKFTTPINLGKDD